MRIEPERSFQACIIELSRMYGWLCYSVPDSRRCTSNGWPDIFLMHPVWHKALARELKTDSGRVSKEQAIWRDGLLLCNIDAGIWRPRDWPTIVKVLTGADRDR